jgi:hypothetical protein
MLEVSKLALIVPERQRVSNLDRLWAEFCPKQRTFGPLEQEK